ncbi:putative transcription initiation factor IIF subunit alpha [Rosellinia necatrix]|uniref:Putative transcription initiation factor IIF subunit alpha n=1 Tax=Rosellinia necatrix TaxID=77044 RepID=A0A1W2TTS1_ROSNE|nr:putative transcription initiation factor IIF subunit alpha [Rosellinia necatrix]
MSASPSAGPNGQKPPPREMGHYRRQRPNAGNPMVPRKKPVPRPLPATTTVAHRGIGPSKIAGDSKPVPRPDQSAPRFESQRAKNGGWATPLPDGGQEFPLFVTKKALKDGLRFHVMRIVPQKRGVTQAKIDPADQEQFPRPVTLQRRDPRQPPPGHKEKEEPVEQPPPNSEEAERQAQLKAQRDAQRALDDAQKAPVLKEAERKRQQQKNKDEKKTGTQIHYQPRTEKQKKEAEIRYEEALPWHLEDADGKQIWVGQYEAPLSNLKVALVPYPETGGYRMLPLEKWYKFTPKRGAFQHMTIEEAEKLMGKKAAPTRWAIRDNDRNKAATAREESRRIMYGPTAVKQESSTFQSASRREKMEHDDIDMSGDEFQDDDETAGFEPDRDEDAKDTKERVRREQLGANLFGAADEKEVEKEEAEVQKEEEERKVFGKDLKKALRKRDKQFQYDSDSSNEDPFASSSSESGSDSEKEDEDAKADKDKNGAGSSSKGPGTPQGKKAAADAAKKGKSLKRPGSPLGSDSSGAESTRNKKKKKLGPTNSVAGSRGATPLPGGQPARGAGSTSDGEATAGEMSDGAGGKIKRRPHLGTGAKGTPAGSRASSPWATSPGVNQDSSKPVTAQEILAALPALPSGITIGGLLKVFENRVGEAGSASRKEWLQLVKENTIFTQSDKLLRRKA